MKDEVKLYKAKFQTENSIEQAFCAKVKKLGCLPIKLNIWGLRSWPDRLVLGPGRLFEFIEFKRPGEKLTEGQLKVHEKLREWGFYPLVFDDAAMAAQHIAFKLSRK